MCGYKFNEFINSTNPENGREDKKVDIRRTKCPHINKIAFQKSGLFVSPYSHYLLVKRRVLVYRTELHLSFVVVYRIDRVPQK